MENMILEVRIKKIMDSIIEAAYPEVSPETMRRFKGYYLTIEQKELATTNGMYHYDGSVIHVYNASRGEKALAKTCIHELSHHIDRMLHGTSGHQAPFYEVYKRLMFASLDLGVLDFNDFYDDEWSRDQNKVRKILDSYVPKKIEDKPGPSSVIIKVYNAYAVKDKLKLLGYHWNKMEQTWEKESKDIDSDKANLEQLSVYDHAFERNPYYSITKNSMYVNAIIYIEAIGNTFEYKEKLKERGFFYNRTNKKWMLKVSADRFEETLLQLRKDNELTALQFKKKRR